MDWSGYRFFLAVAETGSLSAAARRLRVSQPTVGRQILALEAGLETKLFLRTQHGYGLTPAGKAIVELAKGIEERAIAIQRRVGGLDQSLSGRVCIAAAEGISNCWLAPRVRLLKERFPDIEIELKVGTATLDMMRGEADVALRIGDPVSDELVGRCVTKVSFGLFASRGYLARYGEPRTMEDLASHAVIGSAGEIANLPQVRELEILAGTAAVSVTCNCLMTQFNAMRHDLGLLAIPNYMAATAPEVRRVLSPEFEVSLDLWLLTHRDLRETARVRAVIDFLCQEIRGDRSLFQEQTNSLDQAPPGGELEKVEREPAV